MGSHHEKSSRSPQISAGLLMFRQKNGALEIFLGHPGGPLFKNKDIGYWGIPKGLIDPGEDLLQAAKREFEEEVGLKPDGDMMPLGSLRQASGKIVHAWAFAGDWPDGKIPECNLFDLEWPPHSGKIMSFPEIDQARFFSLGEAKERMNPFQYPFVERLKENIKF